MPFKDPEARKEYLRQYAAKHPAYARVKAWRKANPDKVAEQNKRYVAAHPDVLKAKTLRSKHKNIEARRAKDRIAAQKYRAKNKEVVALQKAKYARSNAGKINAAVAKREAAKRKRTPCWLTEDDFWILQEAYSLAALRTKVFGFSWHVDHVVPLQGKTVSGLHTPLNIQVIPGVENIRKGNRVAYG